MNRLRSGVLLATIAFGLLDVLGVAQGHGLFVVVADGSGQRGGFQPDSQPRDVANTIARVSVFLPQKDVRLPDGQIVTGFGFDGWTEGEGVRVVVSALLPADGTNRYVEMKRGMRPSFLQAKRWEKTIGRPDIQQFAGALQGQRARKGVFITTSSFRSEARDYASRIDTRIILIDGTELARLMIAHGVGVTPVAASELKRVDSDYFAED